MPSTVCWMLDARTTSASPDPERDGASSPIRTIPATRPGPAGGLARSSAAHIFSISGVIQVTQARMGSGVDESSPGNMAAEGSGR
jgi:hypothetical protein